MSSSTGWPSASAAGDLAWREALLGGTRLGLLARCSPGRSGAGGDSGRSNRPELSGFHRAMPRQQPTSLNGDRASRRILCSADGFTDFVLLMTRRAFVRLPWEQLRPRRRQLQGMGDALISAGGEDRHRSWHQRPVLGLLPAACIDASCGPTRAPGDRFTVALSWVPAFVASRNGPCGRAYRAQRIDDLIPCWLDHLQARVPAGREGESAGDLTWFLADRKFSRRDRSAATPSPGAFTGATTGRMKHH